MNGPEHYRQAEVALADSETAVDAYRDREAAIRLLAVAQVHATLALAATQAIGRAVAREDIVTDGWIEALR